MVGRRRVGLAVSELRQALFSQVVKRLQLENATIEKLQSFRSDVFLCINGSEKSIIKLFHWHHRTEKEIAAELWWLFFLQSHGISVSLPLPSPNGQLVEKFDSVQGPYFAVRYEYASGVELSWREVTEEVAEEWGQLVGRLHELSRAYSSCLPSRRLWIEEANYDISVFGEDQVAEYVAAASLIRDVMRLPRTLRSFGLIHADLHPGNLRFDGERFVLIDADSSTYHWYLYDFAVILHDFVVLNDELEDKEGFVSFFLPAVLRGYRRFSSIRTGGWKPARSVDLLLELEQLGSIVLSKKHGYLPKDLSDWTTCLTRMLERLRSRKPPLRIPAKMWSGR